MEMRSLAAACADRGHPTATSPSVNVGTSSRRNVDARFTWSSLVSVMRATPVARTGDIEPETGPRDTGSRRFRPTRVSVRPPNRGGAREEASGIDRVERSLDEQGDQLLDREVALLDVRGLRARNPDRHIR